jgi:hypothetical protein
LCLHLALLCELREFLCVLCGKALDRKDRKEFRKGRKKILVKELLSMEQMLSYAGPELGECIASHLARNAQGGTPEGVSYAGMAISPPGV